MIFLRKKAKQLRIFLLQNYLLIGNTLGQNIFITSTLKMSKPLDLFPTPPPWVVKASSEEIPKHKGEIASFLKISSPTEDTLIWTSKILIDFQMMSLWKISKFCHLQASHHNLNNPFVINHTNSKNKVFPQITRQGFQS